MVEFALTFGGQFNMNRLIPLLIPILFYPVAGLNSSPAYSYDNGIDLLQVTYEYQYQELLRRVELHPEAAILKDLIHSINKISQKYTVIAPQIKIYDYDIANQYLVVVNLLEQLIERED